ncbi:hypothetical protein PanWU01x14_194270 [Parasponia andersonii]|uniref:Uncharacterized protein n=1 Tax=Parasponia andersonii TaxID=3476 RepID=A0A2P5C0I4_PARAD|nr:hypothetical protein PanWU01x14_194270 [Parasponia andersonii]
MILPNAFRSNSMLNIKDSVYCRMYILSSDMNKEQSCSNLYCLTVHSILDHALMYSSDCLCEATILSFSLSAAFFISSSSCLQFSRWAWLNILVKLSKVETTGAVWIKRNNLVCHCSQVGERER